MSFKRFLDHFPSEELPLTLSQENLSYFSNQNPPLPDVLIRRFIMQAEGKDDSDDFTEYIPCFQIPKTGKIHAIVYWRGKLLAYDFIIATFNKNGVLLAKKSIAGIRSDGSTVKHAIATIDEDWIISIMTGEQDGQEEMYDPAKSKATSMELLANGEIVYSIQE